MNPALYDAIVRAARTLVAAAIAALVTTLPQAAGFFSLDPVYTGAIVLAGTSLLNGIGKYFRPNATDAGGSKIPV